MARLIDVHDPAGQRDHMEMPDQPRQPTWVRALAECVLCGLGGALTCLASTLILMGTTYPRAFVQIPAFGIGWGILAGVVLRARQWFAGRVEAGLTPTRLILPSLVMAGVLAAAIAGSVVALNAPGLHPTDAPAQLRSKHITDATVAGMGLYGGAAVFGLVCGWRGRSRSLALGKMLRAHVIGGAIVCAGCAVLWLPFTRTRELARSAMCTSNLKSLGMALSLYARDHGGRLPPAPSLLEMVGFGPDALEQVRQGNQPLNGYRRVLGGEPFHAYAKNTQILFCPSDPLNYTWRGRQDLDCFPTPGLSYTWNSARAGRPLAEIPVDEWLFCDRDPWHNGGRNLVHADGRAEWRRG